MSTSACNCVKQTLSEIWDRTKPRSFPEGFHLFCTVAASGLGAAAFGFAGAATFGCAAAAGYFLDRMRVKTSDPLPFQAAPPATAQTVHAASQVVVVLRALSSPNQPI